MMKVVKTVSSLAVMAALLVPAAAQAQIFSSYADFSVAREGSTVARSSNGGSRREAPTDVDRDRSARPDSTLEGKPEGKAAKFRKPARRPARR